MQPQSKPQRIKVDQQTSARFFAWQLLLLCAWMVICIVLLVILVPPSTWEGVIIRCVLAIVPTVLVWALFAAGRGSSNAIMALLLLILIATELSLRNRELSDTSVDPQNIIKAGIWGCGLIVALLNWKVLQVALREPAVMLLALLALWFICSSFYSPIALYSFGAGLAFLSLVLFGAVARASVPERKLISGAITALGIMLWLSIFLYVVAPQRVMAPMEGGTILRLAGVFGSPNSLGRIAALVLLLCAVALRTRLVQWYSPQLILMGAASVVCLLLSQSRTAAAALIAALFVIFVAQHPKRLLVIIIVGAIGFLFLMLIGISLTDIALTFSRTNYVSEATTLTGRTHIWAFFWEEIQKSPIFGYGYGSSKFLMPLLYRTDWGWTTTHAHNMWLQVWFTAGVIGVTLLFAVFVAQFYYLRRSRDIASLALFSFVLVFGFAESNLVFGAPSVLTALWTVWLAGRRPALQTSQSISNSERYDRLPHCANKVNAR